MKKFGTMVVVHRVFQAYGGPEEGGWYYPRGEVAARKKFRLNKNGRMPKRARLWARNYIEQHCYVPPKKECNRWPDYIQPPFVTVECRRDHCGNPVRRPVVDGPYPPYRPHYC